MSFYISFIFIGAEKFLQGVGRHGKFHLDAPEDLWYTCFLAFVNNFNFVVWLFPN